MLTAEKSTAVSKIELNLTALIKKEGRGTLPGPAMNKIYG
jgi:hypothetical protein